MIVESFAKLAASWISSRCPASLVRFASSRSRTPAVMLINASAVPANLSVCSLTNASAEARLSSGSDKLQHLPDKFTRVEQSEVVDLLAGPDKACWNFQFILNS